MPIIKNGTKNARIMNFWSKKFSLKLFLCGEFNGAETLICEVLLIIISSPFLNNILSKVYFVHTSLILPRLKLCVNYYPKKLTNFVIYTNNKYKFYDILTVLVDMQNLIKYLLLKI